MSKVSEAPVAYGVHAGVQATDFRKLNALEARVVASEDDANEALWEQSAEVAALRDAGKSQREIAANWINPRTGEPYDKRHVYNVLLVWERGGELTPHPNFRELYNEVGNAPASDNHRAKGTGENEWYTPPEYIEAARAVLKEIDLDPASSKVAQQTVRAAKFYTQADDGLAHEWHGRIWLNPPYAQPAIQQFIEKLAAEWSAGRTEAAVLLTHNYTDTAWFHLAAGVASAILFTRGRIGFVSPNGERAAATQGQAFFYLGSDVDGFAAAFSGFGLVVRPEVP